MCSRHNTAEWLTDCWLACRRWRLVSYLGTGRKRIEREDRTSSDGVILGGLRWKEGVRKKRNWTDWAVWFFQFFLERACWPFLEKECLGGGGCRDAVLTLFFVFFKKCVLVLLGCSYVMFTPKAYSDFLKNFIIVFFLIIIILTILQTHSIGSMWNVK